MYRTSYADSHAMDADVSRAASRAGSISTLWSSAEVPLCLDPRVQGSSDGFAPQSLRGHSIAGSISRSSARSSQISMDFGRLSIDIPDEYPRRPDIARLSPPRASASGSSGSSNPSSRVPSFNIGTIDEDRTMPASPISKLSYQPPSAAAEQRILSSRFSEDTIDEPHLPHSGSQGTFGHRLSITGKSSALSEAAGSKLSHSSSALQYTGPQFQSRGMQGSAQAPPTDLYRHAYRFFDKDYSVQPSADLSMPSTPSATDPTAAVEAPLCERPSVSGNVSELSHEGSLQSCSRSQTSTQASTDSASAWSAEDSLARAASFQPTILTVESQRDQGFLTPGSVPSVVTSDPSLMLKGRQLAPSGKVSDSLSIPSLPSLHSFKSNLTTTHAHHFRGPGRRPSTADVYSQSSQVSPTTFSNLPLPPLHSMPSPTEQSRYEVRSYNISPAASPTSKESVKSNGVGAASRSTTSRLLRARVASSPKLRLNAFSLFPSEQAFHGQPPVPPLPGTLANRATERRPSTAQMDGREPFFGRRFRSRTLGESDRAEAAKMKAAVDNFAHRSEHASAPQRPVLAAGLASAAIPQRHASRVSAASSDLSSPMFMQPNPGTLVCSASSPATTNSSLPVTPGLTASFPRTKSRGTGSAGKNGGGGAGWASYLNSGLTLHLEQDHGRALRINMSYLAYDPFGRPEQLVETTEFARVVTPKGPKSRGDKDQEAEQAGTLEFGPSEDGRDGTRLFDMLRKSDEYVLLKHLTVGEDTKADLLTRQAALSLKTLGSHQVSGYERKGRLAWKFAYRIEQDASYPDRRVLVPVRFSCSATLLDPERARKSRLLNLVKKQMVPTLASKAVAPTSQDLPRSPSYPYLRDANGAVTASPASSRRSAKQLAPELPMPPQQLDLGTTEACRNLQQKVSMKSLSASSSMSSGSVQMAKPLIINGRKLIPISLPAGLARKDKIDPALLQANVVSSPQQGGFVSCTSPSGDRQKSTSMHSSATSSSHSHRRALNEEAAGIKCLLSNTPRTTNGAHSSSSRPPTASETIKMEYLARTADEPVARAHPQLRQQRSFGGAVPSPSSVVSLLTPSSFADTTRQRRQRSRATEGGDAHRRPFTADAWGESQYPTREQISTVRAISQQHHSDGGKIIPREVLANFSMVSKPIGDGSGYKTLPAPPRPHSRPRTAQTITAADVADGSFRMPSRSALGVRS